ncbi:hypothetical protein OEZ86_011190 [Tetradesmus obliquus]|nr:hypothetical protein OEZ86_011190 [Tetradesmus obliquus]
MQNNSTHGGVLYLADSASTAISDSRLQGSSAANNGGAAFIRDSSSLSISDSTIRGNVAQWGAGLACDHDSILVVSKSLLQGNTAFTWGGGIVAYRNCKVVLQGVSLHDNRAGYGAAVAARGNSSLEMDGALLQRNNASQDGEAVLVGDQAQLKVVNSSFLGNIAGNRAAAQRFLNNQVRKNGAGLTLSDRAQAALKNCTFKQNVATADGGGIHMFGQTQLHVMQSMFANNNASSAAGLAAYGNTTITLDSCSLRGNSVSDNGAGIRLASSAQATMHNCTVAGNHAGNVASMYAAESSRVSISNCSFIGNNASNAAAFGASGSAAAELRFSAFYNNTASTDGRHFSGVADQQQLSVTSGGVLQALTNTKVLISNCTLSNSSSGKGGAVAALHNTTVAVHDSRVQFNSASEEGGGLYFDYYSKGNLMHLLLTNNSANIGGGGLMVSSAAKVNATDVMFEANTADYGGGFIAGFTAELAISNCSVLHNRTAIIGGGALLVGKSVLRLNPGHTVISGNAAAKYGGGVGALSSGFDVDDLLAVTSNNTARYGADVSVVETSLALIGNTSMHGFVSGPGAGEGILPLTLQVSGHHGLPCEGAAVTAALDGMYSLGTSSSDKRGRVEMFLRVQQPPGLYNITFKLADSPGVTPAVLSLQVRPCMRGEVAPTPGTCLACLPGSYSLDPSQRECQPCPLGADCPGGAAILPLPGWWHSAADSAQMHTGVPVQKHVRAMEQHCEHAQGMTCLPAVIVYVTLSNKTRLDDASFRRSRGFLTQSYRLRFCWWEAAEVTETAVLVAISVFGVNLGPFYQCLLMAVALMLITHLRLGFKPYLHKQTGRAMVRNTHCLLLTTLAGLSFLAYGPVIPGAAYGLAMGGIVLAVNLVYVCSELWQLLRLIDWLVLRAAISKTTHAVQWCLQLMGLSMHRAKMHLPIRSAAASAGKSADRPGAPVACP